MARIRSWYVFMTSPRYGLALALSLAFGPPPAIAASLPPVEATHGMVVSAQRLASEVGLDILKRGGNAVDAAVAGGYALALTQPCFGHLGGRRVRPVPVADGGGPRLRIPGRGPLGTPPR